MRDIRRSVDLNAVMENFHRLSQLASPASCAAVVKADGYGLGIAPISRVLYEAGCEHFFVATLAEGEALRKELSTPKIYVLNGLYGDQVHRFHQAELVPVLNSSEEIHTWSTANQFGHHPSALHVDTGMNRLGLNADEFSALLSNPHLVQQLSPILVMSHLVSSETAGAATNQQQLEQFGKLLAELPLKVADFQSSLANSSGIFLGDPFKFDLCRAGAACYGINPLPGQTNPMQPVVQISAPIVQIREVTRNTNVGYGGSATVKAGSQLATIAAGYADGYPRHASNRASVQIGEWLAPVVGTVSMDLISVDISHLPKGAAAIGDPAYLVGPLISADDLAQAAGTIGYEILTNLGRQAQTNYHR